MRNTLKKISLFKYTVIFLRLYIIKPGYIERTQRIWWYIKDWSQYKKLQTNKNFKTSTKDLYPRLDDKTSETKVDPIYFYQNTWCAEKIFQNKPTEHVDIASHFLLVGIVSKFVKTIMVDIRPLTVTLPSLIFKKGSILDLPFDDNSVISLSSICVIEHIGLGRYGDSLDQFGTEKAAHEIGRVMAPESDLYITVPIDSTSKVYFNAHRAFTRDHIISLFPNFKVVEEIYIYGNDLHTTYDPAKNFGTGLYHLKKINEKE